MQVQVQVQVQVPEWNADLVYGKQGLLKENRIVWDLSGSENWPADLFAVSGRKQLPRSAGLRSTKAPWFQCIAN